MPRIWYEQGFSFSFYASDRDEPPHVHVRKGGAEAKWWLRIGEEQGPREERSGGFNERDRAIIRRIVVSRQRALLERWNDFFSPPQG